MTTTNKGRPTYIHALKGPERLPPEAVKDIIESRAIPGARKALAQKHGISETRIGRLWVEYYGGGKLSDYKSGIKKPLPEAPINNADITMRRIKTARGEYMAKDPKFEKIDPKADARKKIRPARVLRPIKELNVNEGDADNISDMDAEIIAGEIGAGNNNPELLDLFDRLLESKDRDTEYLYRLAKRGMKKSFIDTESDYDPTSIEEPTDDDDSTATYSNKKNDRERAHGLAEVPSGTSGRGSTAGMVLRNSNIQSVERLHSEPREDTLRSTGDRARAQPVLAGYPEAPSRGPQQVPTSQYPRYEPQVYHPEHNPRQERVQQDNARNNNQCSPPSEQGQRVPWDGGAGASQTVPGVPWLRKRAN